ncbi:MAG: hypothetical protein SV186_07000 [Candidatus Nanohaloarchaea archaeon]|nr:hypothetical protein [Candidatus Nanohaloarchaea archaeon]
MEDRVSVTVLVGAAVLAGCLGGTGTTGTPGVTMHDGTAILNATLLAGNGTAEFESAYTLEYHAPVLTQFFANGIYFDEQIIGSKTVDGQVVLNVTRTLDPTNSVPEAIVVPLYDAADSTFVGRAYADQDFMDRYGGDLRVYWGRGLRNTSRFYPEEVAAGIYMGRIHAIPVSGDEQRLQWALGNFSTTPLEEPYDGVGVYTE